MVLVATPLALVLASSSVKMYAASPSPETAVAVTFWALAWLANAACRSLPVVPGALLKSMAILAPDVVSL